MRIRNPRWGSNDDLWKSGQSAARCSGPAVTKGRRSMPNLFSAQLLFSPKSNWVGVNNCLLNIIGANNYYSIIQFLFNDSSGILPRMIIKDNQHSLLLSFVTTLIYNMDVICCDIVELISCWANGPYRLQKGQYEAIDPNRELLRKLFKRIHLVLSMLFKWSLYIIIV